MGWTPGIVPYGADETAYLVVDSLGARWSDCETEIERPDLETIISDLLDGQFSNPVRVIAFNTLEHWSKDVSRYVAEEIQIRCDIESRAVPDHIRDFLKIHAARANQAPRLRGGGDGSWRSAAKPPTALVSPTAQGRF